MPSAYLKKLHEDLGIPIQALEDYWEKAKDLAKKNGKEGQEFWEYTSGIFKRMSKVSISRDVPDWWKKLSPEKQAEYMQQHHTKLKMFKQVKEPEANEPAAKTSDETPEVEDEAPPGLPHRPRSKHRKIVKHKRVSIRSLATGAWNRKRQATKNVLRHHKQGFSALRKFLTGGEIGAVEQERAKRTAELTAKLVVGALVGIALFTPLAMLAAPLAAHYLQAGGLSESTDNSDMEDTGEDTGEFALKFADKMHDWLIKQDIPALI